LPFSGRICGQERHLPAHRERRGQIERRGFASKKPSGRSRKPIELTGMTGQSSTRGTLRLAERVTRPRGRCRPGLLRSACVHRGRPVAAGGAGWGYSAGRINASFGVPRWSPRGFLVRKARPALSNAAVGPAHAAGRFLRRGRAGTPRAPPSSFLREALITRQNREGERVGVALGRRFRRQSAVASATKRVCRAGFSGPDGTPCVFDPHGPYWLRRRLVEVQAAH